MKPAFRQALLAELRELQDQVAAIQLLLGTEAEPESKPEPEPKPRAVAERPKRRLRRRQAKQSLSARVGRLGPMTMAALRCLDAHDEPQTSIQVAGWICEHRTPELRHTPRAEVLKQASAHLSNMEKAGFAVADRSFGPPRPFRLTPQGREVVGILNAHAKQARIEKRAPVKLDLLGGQA